MGIFHALLSPLPNPPARLGSPKTCLLRGWEFARPPFLDVRTRCGNGQFIRSDLHSFTALSGEVEGISTTEIIVHS
jgi:hypothetical protein